MADNDKEKIKQMVKEVLDERQANGERDSWSRAAVDLTNCHNIALQTLQYCLAQGGKFSDPLHFNIVADCAEVCEVAASFLLRDSEKKKDMLELCAKICDACAEYCNQYSEDKHMSTCAQYASQAAESCKELL